MIQLPFLPDLVVSDTHIGHRNITKFCLRDNAWATTPDAVDELLVASWNLAVARFEEAHGRTPVVLHLGDVGRMRAPQGRSQDAQLMALRGDIFVIRGNHDHWDEEWIEEHGFTVIEPFTFTHQGTKVVVTHHPLRQVPTGMLNLHGHTHNNGFESASRAHRNMSVEAIGMMPRPFLGMVEGGLRLMTEVPGHIDYNADEAARALANELTDLQPRRQ